MLAAFPNGTPQNSKGYIGALASLLLEYPKQVALKCTHPTAGVARETKFQPTVSDLVAWCERELREMRRPIDYEDREKMIREQMEARRIEAETWEEERKTRLTLKDMQEKYGPNYGLQADEKIKYSAESRELLKRANERAFAKECAAAGVDPATATVSPYLAKLIKQQMGGDDEGARHSADGMS